VLVGAGELFEKVGILDGRGDFVVAAGPFAEVDAAQRSEQKGKSSLPARTMLRQVGQRRVLDLGHGDD